MALMSLSELKHASCIFFHLMGGGYILADFMTHFHSQFCMKMNAGNLFVVILVLYLCLSV